MHRPSLALIPLLALAAAGTVSHANTFSIKSGPVAEVDAVMEEKSERRSESPPRPTLHNQRQRRKRARQRN